MAANVRKLVKRCAHRANGTPGSSGSTFSRSERLRARGERANAQLKTWKILRKMRSLVSLVGQGDQAGFLQFVQHAPDVR